MQKKALVLILLLILLIVSAGYILGPGIVKRKLKSELYSKAQIELEYGTVTLASTNPLEISVSNITVKKTKELDLAIKSITARINLLEILSHWSDKSIHLNINVDAVKMDLRTPINTQSPSSGRPSPTTPSLGTFDLKDYLRSSYDITSLDLLFKISKFDVLAHVGELTYQVNGSDSAFKIPSLESPIEIDFGAYLFSQNGLGPLSNIYIPIKSQSHLKIDHGVLNLIKNETTFADIKNSIMAQINLDTLDFDTSGRIQIPKIESLEFIKKNQAQLPISDPMGAVKLEIAAKGNINNIPMTQIKGQLSINALTANLKYKNPDLNLQGPVNLELVSSFTYINKAPAITSANWKLNLDGTEISYKDLLHKNKSVRLATEGTISYSSDLTIDHFRLWFHTMDVSVKGMASLLRASDLTVAVKPIKLQDFKKFLPNNKDYDISGDLELDGQVKGFLNQPKYLTVNLRKILANNIKYYLKFKNDLMSFEGPISFSLLGNILFERSQMITGSINGHSDLTPLIVSQGNEIKKSSADLFKAAWAIQAKDGKLNIDKLYLNTFLTAFTVKGTPPLSKEDAFNLNLDLESLNWKKVKPLLPSNEWLNTISDMKNKGHISVKGTLDPLQPLDSQLAIEANLETAIDTVSLPFNFHLSKQPIADPNKPEPMLTVPEPFIKNATWLKKIHWDQKVTIKEVSFKESSKFQNITLSANIANNSLRASGDVKNLFNGRLAFSDVSIPLTEPDPKIGFNLNSSNISFSPLVDFVMPEYKELISGVANFTVTGNTKMPGTLNFKNDLAAKGHFRIPTSEVNTLKLVDEVKKKLASIKNVGVPSAVTVSNLSASTESDFEIKKSKIQIDGFKIVAKNSDEMYLSGQIQFDLDSKINGLVKLANLPAHGDFLLANQNKAGQIEIPIEIEGNLKQPKWSFAGNTLDKMTQNFFDFQKNKVKAAADRQLAQTKEKVNAEIEKQKKAAAKAVEDRNRDLQNEAKKKLGELFK